MDKDQQQKILDLLNLESGLSDWEITFIEDLHNNLWTKALSDPQAEKLDDIVYKRL